MSSIRRTLVSLFVVGEKLKHTTVTEREVGKSVPREGSVQRCSKGPQEGGTARVRKLRVKARPRLSSTSFYCPPFPTQSECESYQK